MRLLILGETWLLACLISGGQGVPVDCLTYLHAKFSQTPEKYYPVQPIIDYPWDDLPYTDEADAVADLESVKNLTDGLDGAAGPAAVVRAHG